MHVSFRAEYCSTICGISLSVLVLPANVLTVGDLLQVTVTVSSAILVSGSPRSASASVQLQVTGPSTLMLSMQPGDSNFMLSNTDQLSLTALALHLPDAWTEMQIAARVSYVWTAAGQNKATCSAVPTCQLGLNVRGLDLSGSGALLLPATRSANGQLNGRSLVLGAGVLPAGTAWIFTVTATDTYTSPMPSGWVNRAQASVRVLMADPPHPGTCTVLPAVGFNNQTFTAACINFFELEESGGLLYTFVERNSDIADTVLRATSALTSASITLPTAGTHMICAEVTDLRGGLTEVCNTVVISCAPGDFICAIVSSAKSQNSSDSGDGSGSSGLSLAEIDPAAVLLQLGDELSDLVSSLAPINSAADNDLLTLLQLSNALNALVQLYPYEANSTQVLALSNGYVSTLSLLAIDQPACLRDESWTLLLLQVLESTSMRAAIWGNATWATQYNTTELGLVARTVQLQATSADTSPTRLGNTEGTRWLSLVGALYAGKEACIRLPALTVLSRQVAAVSLINMQAGLQELLQTLPPNDPLLTTLAVRSMAYSGLTLSMAGSASITVPSIDYPTSADEANLSLKASNPIDNFVDGVTVSWGTSASLTCASVAHVTTAQLLTSSGNDLNLTALGLEVDLHFQLSEADVESAWATDCGSSTWNIMDALRDQLHVRYAPVQNSEDWTMLPCFLKQVQQQYALNYWNQSVRTGAVAFFVCQPELNGGVLQLQISSPTGACDTSGAANWPYVVPLLGYVAILLGTVAHWSMTLRRRYTLALRKTGETKLYMLRAPPQVHALLILFVILRILDLLSPLHANFVPELWPGVAAFLNVAPVALYMLMLAQCWITPTNLALLSNNSCNSLVWKKDQVNNSNSSESSTRHKIQYQQRPQLLEEDVNSPQKCSLGHDSSHSSNHFSSAHEQQKPKFQGWMSEGESAAVKQQLRFRPPVSSKLSAPFLIATLIAVLLSAALAVLLGQNSTSSGSGSTVNGDKLVGYKPQTDTGAWYLGLIFCAVATFLLFCLSVSMLRVAGALQMALTTSREMIKSKTTEAATLIPVLTRAYRVSLAICIASLGAGICLAGAAVCSAPVGTIIPVEVDLPFFMLELVWPSLLLALLHLLRIQQHNAVHIAASMPGKRGANAFANLHDQVRGVLPSSDPDRSNDYGVKLWENSVFTSQESDDDEDDTSSNTSRSGSLDAEADTKHKRQQLAQIRAWIISADGSQIFTNTARATVLSSLSKAQVEAVLTAGGGDAISPTRLLQELLSSGMQYSDITQMIAALQTTADAKHKQIQLAELRSFFNSAQGTGLFTDEGRISVVSLSDVQLEALLTASGNSVAFTKTLLKILIDTGERFSDMLRLTSAVAAAAERKSQQLADLRSFLSSTIGSGVFTDVARAAALSGLSDAQLEVLLAAACDDAALALNLLQAQLVLNKRYSDMYALTAAIKAAQDLASSSQAFPVVPKVLRMNTWRLLQRHDVPASFDSHVPIQRMRASMMLPSVIRLAPFTTQLVARDMEKDGEAEAGSAVPLPDSPSQCSDSNLNPASPSVKFSQAYTLSPSGVRMSPFTLGRTRSLPLKRRHISPCLLPGPAVCDSKISTALPAHVTYNNSSERWDDAINAAQTNTVPDSAAITVDAIPETVEGDDWPLVVRSQRRTSIVPNARRVSSLQQSLNLDAEAANSLMGVDDDEACPGGATPATAAAAAGANALLSSITGASDKPAAGTVSPSFPGRAIPPLEATLASMLLARPARAHSSAVSVAAEVKESDPRRSI